MWMVRAGRGGENSDEFLEKKVVAFGGMQLGALSSTISKDDLLRLYAENFPDEKEASRASWASQLLRLITEVKVGDDVVFYDRERRRYVAGKVASDYEWLPGAVDGKPHVRRVEWTHEALRDSLSPATRNTLGSVLTLFKVSREAERDIHEHLFPLGAPPPTVAKSVSPKEAEKDEETFFLISEETFEKANDAIEDAINSLSWQQMQELVAGLLRAMGYRTTVSKPGPDRGVDVFASPDGLGLQDPRIFVEVKHRMKEIGSNDVRSFVGGRSKGDKCLYVSTGGFTKDAHYEADRASVALTLVTLPKLRQLVVDFYDKLDPETRTMLPLRRLYWPAR